MPVPYRRKTVNRYEPQLLGQMSDLDLLAIQMPVQAWQLVREALQTVLDVGVPAAEVERQQMLSLSHDIIDEGLSDAGWVG
jgi:hypothetical protein